MPRQGNTVESCIIVDWKIKEGDEVTAETTACEVETDKASFEIPAGAVGTVLKVLWNAGDDVPVLEPIAVIGQAGEAWKDALELGIGDCGLGSGDQSSEKISISNTQIANNNIQPESQVRLDPSPQSSDYPISPRARNLAEKEALFVEAAWGSGPGGRIIERDVLATLENRPALTAAAKAMEAGTIPQQGSGIGGRITAEDITSNLQPSVSAITETPIKGIRKIISDKMLKSLAESAQFTLNASASVSKLQEIRSRIKTSEEFSAGFGLSKITVNDLILFAASRLLIRYPYMNAHKIGDTIRTFENVHLGMAVDTQKGLMVPVIRNANLLSLAQISSEAKRLAAACQMGSAKPEEISGSTFSISNLGSLGITSFTPVLNTPEVAILGVCGIEQKPVLSQSETNSCGCSCDCRLEPHIGFSLTINHQVVDGAPAARFLKALCDAVANIDLLIAAG